MILPLLLALAVAAPPEGFVEVKRGEDCVLYKGPADRGVHPMRAECHWADVQPQVLIAKLSNYEGYDELIFAITDSRITGVEGGLTWVHQVQQTKGIATREVVVGMKTEVLESGATRVSWTSRQVKMELVEGHVQAARNDGAWEVGPHPDGGSQVVHEIAYDPGGSVPGWVVRWFQVGGMFQVMTEVRAAGRSASTTP